MVEASLNLLSFSSARDSFGTSTVVLQRYLPADTTFSFLPKGISMSKLK
jgi:hypothetical protein